MSYAIEKINSNQDSGYTLADLENQLKSTLLYELISTVSSSSSASQNSNDYTKEQLNSYRPKTEAYYNSFINKNILFSYNQFKTFFQALVASSSGVSENTSNSMSETDWANYWYYTNVQLIDFKTYTEAFLIYPYLKTTTESDETNVLFLTNIYGLYWYAYLSDSNRTFLDANWNFTIYFDNYQELAKNSYFKLTVSSA